MASSSLLLIEAKTYPILSELRHDSESYDVYLVGNDSDAGVGAHRLILSTVSPYFKAMFASKMKESTEKVVNVTLFGENILRAVVDFAYLGKVSIDVATLVPLFAAADHFNMQRLMDACNACFYSWKMTAYNCCQWYIDSLQWGQLTEELGARCLHYMSEHIQEVIKTSIFIKLPYKAILYVIQNDSIKLPEIDLFRSVVSWMDENHSISDSNEQLLDYIRYPFISPADLVSVVGPCKMKSSDKYVKALEFHHYPLVDRINAAQFLPRGKGCVLFPLIPLGSGSEGPHPSSLSIPLKPNLPHWSTDSPIVALVTKKSCGFSFRCNGTFCRSPPTHNICLRVLPLNGGEGSEVSSDIELPALQETAVRQGGHTKPYRDLSAKSYSCKVTGDEKSCSLMVNSSDNHQISHPLPVMITFRVTCSCLKFTVELKY